MVMVQGLRRWAQSQGPELFARPKTGERGYVPSKDGFTKEPTAATVWGREAFVTVLNWVTFASFLSAGKISTVPGFLSDHLHPDLEWCLMQGARVYLKDPQDQGTEGVWVTSLDQAPPRAMAADGQHAKNFPSSSPSFPQETNVQRWTAPPEPCRESFRGVRGLGTPEGPGPPAPSARGLGAAVTKSQT